MLAEKSIFLEETKNFLLLCTISSRALLYGEAEAAALFCGGSSLVAELELEWLLEGGVEEGWNGWSKSGEAEELDPGKNDRCYTNMAEMKVFIQFCSYRN